MAVQQTGGKSGNILTVCPVTFLIVVISTLWYVVVLALCNSLRN